jgi:hypothetical protein
MMKLKRGLIAVIPTERAATTGFVDQALLRSSPPFGDRLHATSATSDPT